MEANGPVCVGAPEWLRGRRGASLAIALMAVLAATLIGSALVASTGNMGAKAHQELRKQKSMALAEASLELALQHRLTSQAGSSMAFRMPGAPQALQVDIDTTGLWWKARVDCYWRSRIFYRRPQNKALDTIVRHYLDAAFKKASLE